MTAATVASAAGGGGTNGASSHFINMSDPSLTTTSALVSYLRMEADIADERAKRLRSQAAALSERFGVTAELQSQYELNPDQMPPLDERGVPKYKGKKRGRKRKPRKRKIDPNRRKRQHTAYTLFVKEIYPGVKAQHPELQSKEVISIVAKQWKESLTAEEKRDWKIRAKSTHVIEEDEGEEEEEEEVEEEDEEEEEEEDEDVEAEHGEGGDDDNDDSDQHHHEDGLHNNHLAVAAAAHTGGEAEATAAADAVYQQAVAEMEADEGVVDDSHVQGIHDDHDPEAYIMKEEENEEEEPEEPPTPVRRRRGRPKKS